MPALNVNSMREEPDESLVEDRYNKSSNPVIFCSMIWVTLFSTVSAEAQGRRPVMAIDGGAIGGYWEIGKIIDG